MRRQINAVANALRDALSLLSENCCWGDQLHKQGRISENSSGRQMMDDWQTGAKFSADKKYRYLLWRAWDSRKPSVTFVLLNPSTADANNSDPTCLKCAKWARMWGYGGIYIVNAFALRSPDPRALKTSRVDPVGPDNDKWIRAFTADHLAVNKIIVGWGCEAKLMRRDEQLADLLADLTLYCMKVNDDGSPSHPLYLRLDLLPMRWQSRLKQG